MKVTFKYDIEKDIWCLLNKGKSSNNSQAATKVYQQLVAQYKENPTSEVATLFIQKYVSENDIDLNACKEKFQNDWDAISDEYQKRAEAIFAVSLQKDVVAYLTINNRCPYSIENNDFFVSVRSTSSRMTAMHELWHFYTWYRFGTEEERLGKQKYNDCKEALTVLLNIECKDLMPEGDTDKGYSQHEAMRSEILKFWLNNKDIDALWKHLLINN